MKNLGFIYLHRKLKDKGYYKNSKYFHLWVHLLLSANHEEKIFFWNGENIIIKKGQLLIGRKQLSEDTGIPETTIERALNHFEKNEHQIGQQKTTKFRIITIENWKQYQNNSDNSDNKRTTNGQQTDTNNKEDNDNNEDKTTHERTNLLKTSSFKWKKELRQHREKGGRTIGDWILTKNENGLELLMRKDETGKKHWQTYEDYKKLKLTK